MYIVKKFEIVFSFNVKDRNIFHVYIIFDFPLTYKKCFSALSIRMRMSMLKVRKIPTQQGVQSCKCTELSL